MHVRRWLPIALLGIAPPAAAQQINAARLAIIQAEDRRAANPGDLARLRAGVVSGDPQTARLAVRALGRLERPGLVPDILPALASASPEVRSEAAAAVAQAASAARRGATGGPTAAALLQTFRTRLANEADAGVRAVLAESLARLPYPDPESLALAQQTLTELANAHDGVTDDLGLAKAFEMFVRTHKGVTLLPPALALLRTLVGLAPVSPDSAGAAGGTGPRPGDPPRAARVRRLAIEALTTAGAVDAPIVEHARQDGDAQVRRLAIRAAAKAGLRQVVTASLEDISPMVRLEAVRGLAGRPDDDVCGWTLAATADSDTHVVLQALDQLRTCGHWEPAVTRLADLAGETGTLPVPRGWHRAAHALVALAGAAPIRAAPLLGVHAAAANPFVRVYAARAAQALNNHEVLGRLAADQNDNVAEAAIDALAVVSGAAAAPAFTAALTRPGYQAIRAAARALESCPPTDDVIGALRAARERLVSEGTANSTDARTAIESALARLAAAVTSKPPARAAAPPALAPSIDELRRLAAPRARLSIRGVGVIDIALITVEAPLTVVHFARLAEAGYYNRLTIHRVVANFVLQGGSPDANEYVGHRDHMRDEVGQWPHVRGALGISTRGRDTGDAQFFVDLVDNPRLDHEYTVFAQVLTGMEVADRVLEGDVIETVQILAR
jgi:peptidyl-prolyl cis-trans isomerase B (cyclophilin B)